MYCGANGPVGLEVRCDMVTVLKGKIELSTRIVGMDSRRRKEGSNAVRENFPRVGTPLSKFWCKMRGVELRTLRPKFGKPFRRFHLEVLDSFTMNSQF
jgi:hypothetical protein